MPWQGGVPPERCFNLGYFDARLRTMREKPRETLPELYGPNDDVAVYRRANVSRAAAERPPPRTRGRTWWTTSSRC